MATCGYADVPSFHRAEVMVAPALQSEGKQLQFAPIEQLNPDERLVYKVTAKASGEGQVFFRAKLSSKGMGRWGNSAGVATVTASTLAGSRENQ